MPQLPPISHQWTEDDRLRLIYRIAQKNIYFLRNNISDYEKVEFSRHSAVSITMLVGESSAFLEAFRSSFEEYLTEEEK